MSKFLCVLLSVKYGRVSIVEPVNVMKLVYLGTTNHFNNASFRKVNTNTSRKQRFTNSIVVNTKYQYLVVRKVNTNTSNTNF